MRSPAGWRLQKQSEPNDSAKLGACEMTLCSVLKGQRAAFSKEGEKCTFKTRPSVSLPPTRVDHESMRHRLFCRVAGKGHEASTGEPLTLLNPADIFSSSSCYWDILYVQHAK